MQSSAPAVGPAGQPFMTGGACVLCRTRKLRCDKNPQTCANCQRAGEICMAIEAATGRQYARMYIDDLRTRAASLRARTRTSKANMQTSLPNENEADAVSPLTGTLLGEENDRHFGGDSSILSLGFLVAAAVSVQLPAGGGMYLDSSKRNNQSVDTFAEIAAPLPPLAEAYELVAVFFDKGFHKVSPFMRRDYIYQQISRVYESRCEPATFQLQNDLFQIFMIFALGNSHPRKASRRPSAISYYAAAMKYSDSLFASPADMQIRNTLLLVAFAYQQDSGIGSKWKLARQALRIAVYQGYHQNFMQPAASTILEEERRRLFWCCYVQERFAACHLGRPFAIAEEEISAELPRDIRLDETASAADSCDASEVWLLKRQVNLRRISTEVRRQLYLKRDVSSIDSRWKEKEADRLNAALESWKTSYTTISTSASPLSIFETVEYLEINFHRERINIFAALAVPTDLNRGSFRPDVRSLRYCLESSIQIISLYQRLAEQGFCTPNWTYVQDILRSGFMILYCGIHLPHMSTEWTRNDGGGAICTFDSESSSGPTDIILICTSIEDCQRILINIAMQWDSVHPHRIAFQQLSDKVKRMIEARSSSHLSTHQEEEGTFPSMSTLEPMESDYPTDTDFWNAPFDVSAWDRFLDADMDMRDVFGFDVGGSAATWNTKFS